MVTSLPSSVASQVVSVSQQQLTGTVFTTSGIQASNATTSSLRTQRIVTAVSLFLLFQPIENSSQFISFIFDRF